MRIKPILFNADMVRAILDGRKTVTRRLVKPQPPVGATVIRRATDMWMWKLLDFDKDMIPPYQPGDILYVRETFAQVAEHIFWYRATPPKGCENILWEPSIHMPKEAARIFLKVTDVRVERLRDIDDDGAKEEGANYNNGKNVGLEEKMRRTAIERFAEIWDSTIKKKDLSLYGWNANPWVWVIEFERTTNPE